MKHVKTPEVNFTKKNKPRFYNSWLREGSEGWRFIFFLIVFSISNFFYCVDKPGDIQITYRFPKGHTNSLAAFWPAALILKGPLFATTSHVCSKHNQSLQLAPRCKRNGNHTENLTTTLALWVLLCNAPARKRHHSANSSNDCSRELRSEVTEKPYIS